MSNKAIWYSRCSSCGKWEIEGMYFDAEFVCTECLHFGVNMEIEDFYNDPAHKNVPIKELFS